MKASDSTGHRHHGHSHDAGKRHAEPSDADDQAMSANLPNSPISWAASKRVGLVLPVVGVLWLLVMWANSGPAT